jgi:hypothetical protein
MAMRKMPIGGVTNRGNCMYKKFQVSTFRLNLGGKPLDTLMNVLHDHSAEKVTTKKENNDALS